MTRRLTSLALASRQPRRLALLRVLVAAGFVEVGVRLAVLHGPTCRMGAAGLATPRRVPVYLDPRGGHE